VIRVLSDNAPCETNTTPTVGKSFGASLIYDKYSVVARVYEVLPCATSTSLVNAAKAYGSLLSYVEAPVCYVWVVMGPVRRAYL
jgi:hypothetical protein